MNARFVNASFMQPAKGCPRIAARSRPGIRCSEAQRIEVVRKSRRLSRKTARLWQNYYSLGEEEIQCLSTSCPRVGWKF